MIPASVNVFARTRPAVFAGACILAATVVLLLPAAANGSPFVFFDTLHYQAVGKKIVSLLTFHHAAAPEIAAPAAPGAPAPPFNPYAMEAYVGGRSPYYGTALYALDTMFGAWAAAAAQAMVGAWLIWLSVRLTARGAATYAAVIAALTALTSLPWVAAFLMPDIFGGYAILAVCVLAFFWSKLTNGDRLGCIAIVLAAMTFHAINFLLITAIAAIWLARLIVLRRRETIRTFAILSASIVVALAANAAYPAASKLALHKTLRLPPLLTARLVADGPGRDYLRDACARGVPYTLCRFTNQPLNDGDAILWSLDPANGVYLISDPETQRKLIDEQPRFVLGVIAHEPLQQFGASLNQWRRQLLAFSLNDFSAPPVNWRMAAPQMDPPLRPFLNTPAANGTFPFAIFSAVQYFIVALASLFLAYRLTRADVRGAEGGFRALRDLALFALALVVLNAAIAGALSGVFHRYQARVIWLVPLLAILIAARFGVRPAQRASQS